MTPPNHSQPRARKSDRVHLCGPALSVLLLLAPACLGLIGCSTRGKEEAGSPRGPAVPVLVAEATARDVPLEIKAIGNVEPYSTVQVKALLGGQMMAVHFKEGQDVKRGDVLFEIDARPFEIALKQAESSLAKDQALLKNAEDDVNRYAELAQKDYVTRENFEQLRVNAEVLRASVRSDEAAVAEARLQLEYCTIRSPLDGRTGSLMVYPGNIVKANDTSALVVIYQTSPIYVSFSVPEQSLPLIKKHMARGDLKTEVRPGENENPLTGLLTFVDNAIDRSTGTILLKATFLNKEKTLWPGQFVGVVLTLAVEKSVTVVPSQAVQTGQSGQFVMVVGTNLTVESRPVEVERTYEGDAVIGSGLKPGEIVVTDGLLRLVPGSRVEIKKSLSEGGR
jgi:multidrug efflux system membrane fusion protein